MYRVANSRKVAKLGCGLWPPGCWTKARSPASSAVLTGGKASGGAGVVAEGLLAEQPVDGAGGDLGDEGVPRQNSIRAEKACGLTQSSVGPRLDKTNEYGTDSYTERPWL